MAISTIGTYFGWTTDTDENPTLFTKLCDIQAYSDLSGEPNTIETSTLSDEYEQTIPGVQTGGTVTFTAPINGNVISQIKDWQSSNTVLQFCLMFKTGLCFICSGRLSYYVEGKGINDEVTMKIILYKTKEWALQGSGYGDDWKMKKATYSGNSITIAASAS